MSRGIKLVLGGLLGLIVLLILAAVLVVLFVDLNSFKPQIEQAVKDQTGRDLKIEGDLGWSLYPVLGIELGRTELSNAPGFGERPMASVEQVSVGVALLPLFKGKLGVSELVLEKPQIYLARNAQGETNWQDLIQEKPADAQEPAPEQPAESGQQMEIAIEGIRLNQADIEWHDATSDQQVRIAPLTLTTGPIQPGKPTDIQLQLEVANQNPQVNAEITLTTRVASAEDFSWVEWQDLALQVKAKGEGIPAQNTNLILSSSGRLYPQEQTLNMQQSTLSFDVKGLNQNMNVQGELGLAVQGNLAEQSFNSQEVALNAIAMGEGLPGGKAEVSLRTPFSIDLKQQTLTLPAVVASVLGVNLNAKVDGSRIVDDPQFKGTLSVAEFAPKAVLERLAIKLPEPQDPQVLQKATLNTQFTASPKTVNLSQLKVVLDESDLNGTLQAQLNEKTDIGFNLALNQINLDRYLPAPAPDDQKPAAKTGQEAPAPTGKGEPQPEEADPFAWMDQINLNGKIKVGQVQIKKAKLNDILVNVVARDRILTVDPLTASLYGGRQSTKVRIDATGKDPKTQLETAIQTVNVGNLLGSIMSQTPLEGTGSLDLSLNLEGLSLEKIEKSLQGAGELRINDGAFNGVNIVNSIRNNIASLRGKEVKETQAETELKNFLTKFSIAGGALRWQDMNNSAGGLNFNANGGLNLFTQTLNTQLNVLVPENFKSKNDLLSQLAGQTIPVQLGGTLTDPKVSLDVKNLIASQVEQKVQTKVDEKRQELEQKVDQKLQKGLEKLFGGKKKSAEPAPAPTEPAQPAQ